MGGGGKSQAGFGFLFSAETCGGMLKPIWPSGEQTLGLNIGLEFPGLKWGSVVSCTAPGFQWG